MSTPEPFRALVDYALANQPVTLREAQALLAERERRSAPPPPEDPAAVARAVQNAAIRQARDIGIQAGLATGRALERNRHVR